MSELRATNPADLDQIVDLLRTAFGASPDAPFVQRPLLEWKYFAARPGWDGSRSYVLQENNIFLAHACVWPLRIAFRGAMHTAMVVVDWAGARKSPGTGVQLLRKLAPRAEIFLALGGSPATQQVMPRIGCKIVARQTLYARVLRFWQQFHTRPGAVTPRELARLVRNARFALSRRASAGAWSLRRVPALSAALLNDCVPDGAPASLRCPEFIGYLLSCPAVDVMAYELIHDQQPRGYLMLTLVNGQCRIAEMRVRSTNQEDWTAAIGAVLDTALTFPGACELVAWTAEPRLCAALEASGFRPRGARPVFVQDPGNLIPEQARWDPSMLDDDTALLNVPQYPFAT